MTQPDLFSVRPLARATDPQTSKQAAHSKLPSASSDAWKIMELLYLHPEGLNAWELSVKLEAEKPTISSRCSQLKNQGFLFEDGVRPTNTNRNATVYRLVDPGWFELMKDLIATEEKLTMEEIFPGIPPRHSSKDKSYG